MLQFMGLQRVGHDLATELKLKTTSKIFISKAYLETLPKDYKLCSLFMGFSRQEY